MRPSSPATFNEAPESGSFLLKILYACAQLFDVALDLQKKIKSDRNRYSVMHRVGTFQSCAGMALLFVSIMMMPETNWISAAVGLFGFLNILVGNVHKTVTDLVAPFCVFRYAEPAGKLQVRFEMITELSDRVFRRVEAYIERTIGTRNIAESRAVQLLRLAAAGNLEFTNEEHSDLDRYFQMRTDDIVVEMPSCADPAFRTDLAFTKLYRTFEFMFQASTGLIFVDPNFTQFFYVQWGIQTILYAFLLGTAVGFAVTDMILVLFTWKKGSKTEAELNKIMDRMHQDVTKCSILMQHIA